MTRLPRSAALVVLVVVALGALVACGDDGDAGTAPTPTATVAPPTGTEPAPEPPSTADEVAVGVYFVTAAGAVEREERLVPSDDPVRAALDALAAGPQAPESMPALPEGTTVLGVGRDGDVVTVDLSAEFESGYPAGGAAAEFAVLAPLVRTAVEASGAEAVLVTVEGRIPQPTGTQYDLSVPLAPGDVGG